MGAGGIDPAEELPGAELRFVMVVQPLQPDCEQPVWYEPGLIGSPLPAQQQLPWLI